MPKVNFRKFKVFKDITRTSFDTIDIRRVFSDIIYKNGTWIEMRDFAVRILESDDEIELSEGEVTIARAIASRLCTPVFIDSLEENIKE